MSWRIWGLIFWLLRDWGEGGGDGDWELGKRGGNGYMGKGTLR